MSAAAAAAPQSTSPSSLQFLAYLQQYGASFTAAANAVMFSLEGWMLSLSAAAVVFLLILGVLLHYSGISRRLGKQFIEGGVIIAVFVAFGVPYLMNTYCPPHI